MKFAYKINSSYDRFTPAAIPERMHRGRLTLGWKRYIEAVEMDAKVWVYFRGPDRFTDGVYVDGTVRKIDLEAREVVIRVDRFSTADPLTDQKTSEAVARVVSTPYRQVFYLPEDLLRVFKCDINGTATSCAKRRCSQCVAWPRLPRVGGPELNLPARLRSAGLGGYAPAYWVIARRSWPLYQGREVRRGIKDTTYVFNRFKTGTKELAYPLARGIAAVLKERHLHEADFIVPIPLSPDKAKAKELHRTLALANELSQLLGINVRQALSLDRPISKRALGASADVFERRYGEALSCAGMRPTPARILLVDDVCTHGSTLAMAARAIRQRVGECEVIACAAGQMTVREALAQPDKLLVEGS
jgi:hypothetical protein